MTSCLYPCAHLQRLVGDGRIAATTFEGLSNSELPKLQSSRSPKGKVLHLELTKNLRTGRQIIIGGGDDGFVAIWDYKWVLL